MANGSKNDGDLRRKIDRIYTLGWVCSVFGLLGSSVALYCWHQLRELQAATDKVKKILPSLIEEANAEVLKFAQEHSTEKFTFFQKSQYANFVNIDTGASLDLSATGSVQYDCGRLVPDQAQGVIVCVVIKPVAEVASCTFTAADASGEFGVDPRFGNSFVNSSRNWVGGTVFCPFYKGGGHSFRYRLYADNVSSDKKVACIGTVIGWF